MLDREKIFYYRVEKLIAIIAKTLVIGCDNITLRHKIDTIEAIDSIVKEK